MSTNNKLREYITEEIQSMPKETQSVILNFNWENIIEEIGKNHKLSEEEILALKIETALVFIGLTAPGMYPQNIQNNIIIGDQETSEIVKEVTEKIFNPMLKNITEVAKKNKLGDKNTLDWQENLDFIMTGGKEEN